MNEAARMLVALQADPRLRRLDEPAQLFDQDAGGSAVPFESLDPVEPVDHGAGFVHAETVPRKTARARAEFVTTQTDRPQRRQE
jgi:hypothetical protein